MEENILRGTLPFSETVSEIITQGRVPLATYRLQFGPNFTFQDAQGLVPYFHDLGISDLYASPLFKPCSEQSHGYDICDHTQFNPAIGSQEQFDELSKTLQNKGMGLILDVVPNHMGISGDRNIWWMDILENGPSSPYSCFFDIDWQPVKPELHNKILLPILGDQYGKVLEGGQLRLAFEKGAFFIYYFDNKLPVAPRTYIQILAYPLDALANTLGKESQYFQEFESILTALRYLPLRTESDPKKLEERKREKEVIKRRIMTLYQNSPEVRAAVDQAVKAFNGKSGDPHSFDLLDALLRDQAYRPAFWRVASDEINYRRFFEINNLAAIRMEHPEVFRETHQFIFQLLVEGKVTGLRIDHPDGLRNPRSYFLRLQETHILEKVRAREAQEKGQPNGEFPQGSLEDFWKAKGAQILGELTKAPSSWPLYVVAEKILSKGESLPEDWAVCGTTGYDFLNAANGLFVYPQNARAFERIYEHFIGKTIHFPSLINASKKMIMLVSLASEINSLSHALERISEKNRWYRDFTLNSFTFALREIIAALPVYRTYTPEGGTVSPRDQSSIEAAAEEAKRQNPRTAEAVFDFLRDTLLLRNLGDFPEEEREKLIHWVMKFQQITGPVMAKGVEDTAFYIYTRLVSLNEVGGHPDQFGVSVAAFHQQNVERQRHGPHSLLATSTHDTKRSEDIRARLNVLSEIPERWKTTLNRWSRLNASQKALVDGNPAPDSNDEYLLYQTLVGAWPTAGGDARSFLPPQEFDPFRERIAAYMHKATREAKVHTSWVNPNEEYDAAVRNFVLRVLEDNGKNRFLKDLRAFQRWVANFGRYNSLAQVLLKLTSPGVPDMYQGTELWDFSLVDPDNRRPVDFQRRCALLSELRNKLESADQDLIPLAKELLEASHDGRIKLYLIFRTLNFRRDHSRLFSKGMYLPLEALGKKRDHVCAFARAFDEEAILVVTPRLLVQLTGGVEQPPLGGGIWKDTWLPPSPELEGGVYRNLFTMERLSARRMGDKVGFPLAEVFSNFPVALLERITP